MNKPITISLYLPGGDPSGIACTYISNWTGQCIKIPRNLLDKSKERAEVTTIGVYLLIGFNDDNPDDTIIYIGEADNVYKRLVQHVRDDDKSFWNEAIVFSSKDDFLTKGHIEYLEHELIHTAKNNPNYTVHNGNRGKKTSLPEMAIADMQTFLDNISIILPTLGVKLFDEISITEEVTENIFTLKQKGINAKGFPTNNGFLVLKGSEMAIDTKSLRESNKRKRLSLIEKELVKLSNDKYIFQKDYEFNSPSQAAALIVGHAKNGRIAWIHKEGRSLKEIQEAEL